MADENKEQVTLVAVALRLSGVVHSALGGRIRARELVAELRAVADWIEGGTKPATPDKVEVTTQVEAEIFQYWVARFGKTKARFTPERRTKMRARLREGYTPEDLRRAIDGCKSSGFHNGENETNTEYNDLVLIFRSGRYVEKFRDLAKEGGIKPLAVNKNEANEARIQELTRDGAEALRKGDVNAYNRTEAEIRRLSSSVGDDGAGQRQAG